MRKKRAYIVCKVLDIIALLIIICYVIAGVILAFIVDGFSNIAVKNAYLISLFAVLFVIVGFIAYESILGSVISKKTLLYINKSQYNEGLDFLGKVSKFAINCDLTDKCYYYKGLLNLYIDNIDSAINAFNNIELSENYVFCDIQLSSLIYLYLIYLADNSTLNASAIYELYQKRKPVYKRALKRYPYISENIDVIEDFHLKNDKCKSFLERKTNMPLLQRLLNEFK